MTEETLLTDDQIDDANFRAKDSAWVAITKLFDARAKDGMTYASLGRRIRRSRAQVQRWFDSPFNLNLRSLGLLAEGMDGDLVIDIRPRVDAARLRVNFCHPSEDAAAAFQLRGVPDEPGVAKIVRAVETAPLGSGKSHRFVVECTE